MGAQISWLDRPSDVTSDEKAQMPGHFEPFTQAQKKVSILEGASDSIISGGTFNAAGRDIVSNNTTTTVNNIIINFLDGKPLSDTDILEWLSAINFRAIQMENLDKVAPGTGSWFLESEIFLQWLVSQEGILWGIGMPGSGKTLLAAIVINHLQAHAKLQGPKIALAFAYCRYTSPAPVQQILAALIRQLLERYPFLYPLVQPIYEEHRREMTKPSLNQLLDLLRDISRVFDVFYCALDGLDEATEDDQFKLLDALSSVKANFFITSRPLESLRSCLPGARFFTVVARDEDIHKLIDHKLKQSPRLTAMLDAHAEGSAHKETIVAKITRKADGMFLHAALQVETIQQSVSLRHVLTSLDQLPSNIEDMYAETMRRIDMQPSVSAQLARRILTWVVFARDVLTMDDLRTATAINIAAQPIPQDNEIMDALAVVNVNTLLSVCCGLITAGSNNGSVRLVHFTALEWLKRELATPETELILSKTCIRRLLCPEFDNPTYTESHGLKLFDPPILGYASKCWIVHVENTLTQAAQGTQIHLECIQDLLQLIVRRSWVPGRLAKDPAIRYFKAPWNGFDPLIHLFTILPRDPPNSTNESSSRISPNSTNPESAQRKTRAIHQLITLLQDAAGFDINRISSTVHGDITALVFAVAHGNIEMVQRLLNYPGIEVNPGDSDYTPLKWALEGHRLDIATLLLDHILKLDQLPTAGRGTLLVTAAIHARNESFLGRLLTLPQINVNQANAGGSTALLVAIPRGLGGIVSALLDHPDIDINQRDKQGWTALLLAVEYDCNDISFKLLEREELEPNTPGPRGGCTALMTAAWLDNVEVVQRLVALPRIQVNAVDETGQTALAHALHCGHVEVAKAILDSQKANVNLERPSDGLTPLMMAVMLSGVDTSSLLPLLLHYPGMNVNHQTKEGVTALILAVYHGNTLAVHLLLEHPDVDVTLETDQGATALDFALSQGHEDVVEMLRRV